MSLSHSCKQVVQGRRSKIKMYSKHGSHWIIFPVPTSERVRSEAPTLWNCFISQNMSKKKVVPGCS